MWDLIVSVPDHCLSFYFTLERHTISMFKSLISKDARSVHVKCTAEGQQII